MQEQEKTQRVLACLHDREWEFNGQPLPPLQRLEGLVQLVTALDVERGEGDGIILRWSAEWFPGATLRLDWAGYEAGAPWYVWDDRMLDVWIPPVLINFEGASPDQIWIAIEPA